jgi:hypothetical protein
MSVNLGVFAQRITVRAENVPMGATRLKRRVALAIDQNLVQRTPVDTGRARSNWLVNLSSSRDDEIDPYAPNNGGASAAAALAQGMSEIGKATPATDIHITNNVAYLKPLNEGTSAQAPAHFVEASIRDGVKMAIGGTGAKVELTNG